MFVNKHFTYLGCVYLKRNCYNAKPSAYYFYMKTKIVVDFHICINVPSNFDENTRTSYK